MNSKDREVRRDYGGYDVEVLLSRLIAVIDNNVSQCYFQYSHAYKAIMLWTTLIELYKQQLSFIYNHIAS